MILAPIPILMRILPYAAAGLVCFMAGWHFSSKIWQGKMHAELAAQKEQLIKQCQDNVKITEEASSAYQKKLATANKRIADYQRMYKGYNVRLASSTNGSNATTGGNINAGQNGVPAVTLFDIAGQCDKYKEQVTGLQAFINAVWDK